MVQMLQFISIVLTVAHKKYLTIDLDVFREKQSVVYDSKGSFGSG